MEDLALAMQSVTEELADLEHAREDAIRESRKVIRMTKEVIHSVHLGTYDENMLLKLNLAVDTMLAHCNDPRVLHSGPVNDALSEYSEAVIFVQAVCKGAILDHKAMHVDAGSWLMGFADSIGEMRRMVLNHLNNRDIDSAKALFGMMECFYDQLAMVDVPDAVVPLRRKQDIARGIMDRTRSDLTTAIVMSRF